MAGRQSAAGAAPCQARSSRFTVAGIGKKSAAGGSRGGGGGQRQRGGPRRGQRGPWQRQRWQWRRQAKKKEGTSLRVSVPAHQSATGTLPLFHTM